MKLNSTAPLNELCAQVQTHVKQQTYKFILYVYINYQLDALIIIYS